MQKYNVLKNISIYAPHLIFSGDKIEKNEMGLACSTNGGEDRRIQDFGWET